VDVRPNAVRSCREPVHPPEGALDRQEEEDRDQQACVGDGQHLQQERGRTTDRPITTENDDAQHVAGDAERAQSSDDVDVDGDYVLYERRRRRHLTGR